MQTSSGQKGWSSVRLPFIVLTMAFVLNGCTPRSHLHRVTLWEGAAECTVCQARAVTLWPDGPARVSLRKNAIYTAQLDMDTPGDPDRCILKFVSGTWYLPDHSFDCDTEQDVIRRSISTQRTGFYTGPDTLSIGVSVYSKSDPFGTGLQRLLDEQKYEVDWVE